MTTDEKPTESFGERLARITQEVRAARRLEEARQAELVRAKAERAAAIAKYGEEFLETCVRVAEAAANDEKNSVTLKLITVDPLTLAEVGDWLLVRLQEMKVHADLAGDDLTLSWDVPAVEASPPPPAHPFDVLTTPVMPQKTEA